MAEEKQAFNCTRIELRTVAKTGWNSVEANLAAFAAFKLKYTATFIVAKRTEITTAQNLPDYQSRTAELEVMTVELKKAAQAGRALWQKLKRYIEDAFEKAHHKARLEEAGALLYDKAGRDNWEFVAELMQKGDKFIDDHLTELTAGDNMPPTFETTFGDGKSDFDTQFQAFLDEKEAIVVASENNLKAHNVVHGSIMSAMDDGKEIFRDEVALRKQFVFDTVLALIRQPGGDVVFEELVPGGTALSITQDFSEDQEFEIENDGTMPMWFYTSDTENGGYQGWGVMVNPGQKQKFSVAELGGLRVYLNVHNQNGTEGSFKVKLVEA
jgi:hypothetical protein